MSFWASLGRGGVEVLVSGGKMKRYNGQIMRAVWEFLLFCWLVIHSYGGEHPGDRRGIWPRGTQGNTCQGDTALCPKYSVLEIKSSGVKWFGWEESIQRYIRDQALKLSIKICVYQDCCLAVFWCTLHVLDSLWGRSRSYILNLSLWRAHLGFLFPERQLTHTMELLKSKKSKLL